MSKEKQIEERECGNCLHHYACALNSEYLPTPCDAYESKAGYRKQSEGHWEIVKGSNGKEKMVCTNCQHQQDLASTFTYCPNCGAKMGGGAE